MSPWCIDRERIGVFLPLTYKEYLFPSWILLQLPPEVRIAIWETLFIVDHSPIVIGETPKTRWGNLAILRTYHGFHRESSVGIYQTLYRRKIILESYGARAAKFFKSHSKAVWSCDRYILIPWFKALCVLPEATERNGIFDSVVFQLGPKDPNVAVQRGWQFLVSITSLYNETLVKICSLTIVAGIGKMSGFEKDLIAAFFKGTFVLVEEINFQADEMVS